MDYTHSGRNWADPLMLQTVMILYTCMVSYTTDGVAPVTNGGIKNWKICYSWKL